MISKRKRRALVAGLGLFALLLDALIPIHLAFDLAEALGLDRTPIAAADAARHVLAELVGHESQPAKPGGDNDHHHHHDCAACAAAGTLAAFQAPPAAALPAPNAAAQPVLAATRGALLAKASPAAYRSRAPPLG